MEHKKQWLLSEELGGTVNLGFDVGYGCCQKN